MADEKKVNDEKVKPQVKKPKVIKPKHNTKKYELLEDVQVGDKLVKKGTKYPLTVEGAKYFKSKFYIK
ncbi:hypothetical protein AVT43_gp20 [Polaribacter phage P12002L]|uniref:Uncharacterized protein n=2 Tax=Incheonvirus TaxID=2976977 RepID=A0A0F7DD23_9CAUD|nr:hypothetical protein AVT42_gp20 [Polaribacter phage P12002S]YP_009209680.1 hypothetical protein AVT43_gp20 [Polaribacter phage P12002L]AKG94194.1 hypothetical protein P12002L_0020 [Polaribacter phage P12002L]AKG94276.1 hypothetical protein P12002S_0020 [Polaribacter phage P12002S]